MARDMLDNAAADCAANIIAGVERGKRRIVTGHKSTSLFWLSRLLPNTYPRLLKALSGKGLAAQPDMTRCA